MTRTLSNSRYDLMPFFNSARQMISSEMHWRSYGSDLRDKLRSTAIMSLNKKNPWAHIMNTINLFAFYTADWEGVEAAREMLDHYFDEMVSHDDTEESAYSIYITLQNDVVKTMRRFGHIEVVAC